MVYPHNDNTNDTTRDNIMSSTIHFRIDDETKRLAMLAAERQQMSLTELMRQRAEELAAEELQFQNSDHEHWLEQQIAHAFNRHNSGEGEYLNNDEVTKHMDDLRQRAAQGKL
ncbi:putative DNA-damage-inducible protein J (plasmid) [Pantoea sp. At-9b]|nr:putative DNA-damage-inducible protein J [Pantoea sp. At-9b]